MRRSIFLAGKFFLTLVVVAAATAHAQWWNPSDPTPPGRWGTEFAPKVKYTHQTVEALTTT